MVKIPLNSFESVEIHKYEDGSVLIKHVTEAIDPEFIAMSGKALHDFAVAISEYAGLYR